MSAGRLPVGPGFALLHSEPRTLPFSTPHTTIALPRDRHRSGTGQAVAPPWPRWWPPGGDDAPGCGPRRRRHDGPLCRQPVSVRRDRLRSTIPSPAPVAPVASTAGDGRRWLGRRSDGSGGQLMTALATTSGQNRPTRAGRHAVAKPVPFGPPAVVRLVRALHPWPPTLS